MLEMICDVLAPLLTVVSTLSFSSSSLRHRVSAPCRCNIRGIFLRVHRDSHQGKLRHCLWGFIN